jgi:hypothetical protein
MQRKRNQSNQSADHQMTSRTTRFIADLKSLTRHGAVFISNQGYIYPSVFYLFELAIPAEIILSMSIVTPRFSVLCIVQVDSAVNAADAHMPQYAEGPLRGPLRL